jgi:drug/metabolite transporter (DMT)-like permease
MEATMQDGEAMSAVDWALLILLSILWGGSFFFVRVAAAALPPLTLVFLRFAPAALLVLAYARVRGLRVPRDRRSWAAFAAMGLLNNLVPAALITWAERMIPGGLAAVLIATTPIFSLLALQASGGGGLGAAKLAGMAAGFAGVCVLLRLSATDARQVAPLGILACLGAALSYGCANAFGVRFRALGIAPAIGATGQMAATALMALPLALVLEHPWQLAAPDLAVCAAMAGLVILSTALGYVVFFRILARAGAINLSLVTLLNPVSAMLLGSLVLGERIAPDQLGGAALIALGLLAIDGRLLRRALSRAA